ncbi:MAG: hypothetical protein IPM29_04175 [Planctomycetes bacterium]|nr:hypothetical protein [Planctomycetota bacterium]
MHPAATADPTALRRSLWALLTGAALAAGCGAPRPADDWVGPWFDDLAARQPRPDAPARALAPIARAGARGELGRGDRLVFGWQIEDEPPQRLAVEIYEPTLAEPASGQPVATTLRLAPADAATPGPPPESTSAVALLALALRPALDVERSAVPTAPLRDGPASELFAAPEPTPAPTPEPTLGPRAAIARGALAQIVRDSPLLRRLLQRVYSPITPDLDVDLRLDVALTRAEPWPGLPHWDAPSFRVPVRVRIDDRGVWLCSVHVTVPCRPLAGSGGVVSVVAMPVRSTARGFRLELLEATLGEPVVGRTTEPAATEPRGSQGAASR